MSTIESMIVIDLYGSGVRISDGTNILADSKSYALIESDKSITVGEQAEHFAHLRPRESSTLFWGQLTENSNTKHVISNAEIAYRHLEYVWKLAEGSDQSVILITPVTFNKNELGLLLGICNKLSIKVTGIVCNASLALQHPIHDCEVVFIDLQQQQLVLTELKQSKQEVSLEQPSRIINYGLDKFIHNAANSIAKKFISETRFDPLHNAEDEQQFFDKLPLWLARLNEIDVIECKLSTGENNFSIKCDNSLVNNANKKLFEDLAAHLNLLFHHHNNIAIYCSESCRQAFGLHDYLINLPGCAVIQQNELSLSRQAILYKNQITKGDQVHFVNALPWQEIDDIPILTFSSGKLSNLSSIPTHALLNGYAHSLQQDLYISRAPNSEPQILHKKNSNSLCRIYIDNLSVMIKTYDDQDVILNECKLEHSTIVNINDSLKILGHTTNIQFIKVVDHEE